MGSYFICFRKKCDEQPEEETRKICDVFEKRLPGIRKMLLKDVEALYEGDPAAESREEVMICYPGFFAISIFRLAHELYLLKTPLIPRIMTELAHSKTGIDINPGATIGKYFMIDHGTGIVIGETTQIGEHVKLYQGVTLGALSTSGGRKLFNKKRHPTIEDYVTIYSGASILGGDTVIGRGSLIGGNVFLTHSCRRKPESVSRIRNCATNTAAKRYNEARKCPPPQQVGARIPKQAASISPASLKRQEEVLPMAKLEQRRYKNKLWQQKSLLLRAGFFLSHLRTFT